MTLYPPALSGGCQNLMIESLPKVALETIDAYKHLPIAGKLVPCPYFKNRLGVRAGYRVAIGKGSPSEIATEVELVAQKQDTKLANLKVGQIRQFMEERGLGVDCSGFVAQVLQTINPRFSPLTAATGFWPSPWRFFISRLRPIENLSVRRLTADDNAQRLQNFKAALPGDVIRTRSGRHALLITEVHKLKDSKLKQIMYVHSTSFYGAANGVKDGCIKVIYKKEALRDQGWQESDKNGRNYTHEGFLEDDGLNGIYRLKHLTKSDLVTV